MKSAREKPIPAGRKGTRTGLSIPPPKTKSRPSAIAPPISAPPESTGTNWTFLTNHAHVLAILWWNPSIVLREVAIHVGITERAVQRIIVDLEAGGIIEREKVGRKNRYRIHVDQPLRHPIESHRTIGELLDVIKLVDAPLSP